MALFYFNLLLTIALCGILWFMQVSYLPLLKHMDLVSLRNSAKDRQRNMIMIFFPLLSFELLSSIFLFFLTTQSAAYYYFAFAFLLQLFGLAYIFMQYQKSSKAFDETGQIDAHKNMMRDHLVITATWSLRLISIILALLADA